MWLCRFHFLFLSFVYEFFFEICKWSPLSNHNLGLPQTPPEPFGTPPPPTRFSKKSIDQEIEIKRFNGKIGHLRCYPSSSCVPCCNRNEGWPMYETSLEGSEGELSFLTFNKSENFYWNRICTHCSVSHHCGLGRWKDDAIMRWRWLDGQLHDNDEAMLYHIIISTL